MGRPSWFYSYNKPRTVRVNNERRNKKNKRGKTHFVLVELDGTSLGLALGLGLLPVLILAGRVAPLTRGGGYGARLRPGGDGGGRWCRWRRYRDIGKGTQAGGGRAQGHRTRRRRQR